MAKPNGAASSYFINLPSPLELVPSLKQQCTRETPYLYPQPLRGKPKYDIPGASIVRIFLRHENEIVEGTLFVNPKQDHGKGQVIKVMHPYNVDVDGKKLTDPINTVRSFDKDDILSVYVLRYGKVEKQHAREISLETFVVDTKEKFDTLMDSFAEFDVTEVGVKFLGRNTGKDMQLHWIVLCVRKTIIPIDMYILHRESHKNEIWEQLKKKLFENKRICKVLHDVRSEAAYLFHVSGDRDPIELKNVFDTQMAVYFMDVRQRTFEMQQGHRAFESEQNDVHMPFLSYALKRYLSRVVWNRELVCMTGFEENMSVTDVFCVHPVPDPTTVKYMALTVKYLSKLKEKLAKNLMKCYNMALAKMIDHMKRPQIIPDIGNPQSNLSCPDEVKNEVQHLATVVNVEIFDETTYHDNNSRSPRVKDKKASTNGAVTTECLYELGLDSLHFD